MSKRSKWRLIGIPDHLGVIHVGGRIGAAKGPESFRQIFRKLKGEDGVLESCIDAGDIVIDKDVAQNHRAAAALVRASHAVDPLTVVVGGGHDHGYSHLLGVHEAVRSRNSRIGCINIDAHLDVRPATPVITSGSPFYLALESGVLKPGDFVEFGIQRHCNAPELWNYVRGKGVEVVPFEGLRNGRAGAAFKAALDRLAGQCDHIVISLDLDGAAAAYAPGVSAPQAEGFTASEIIEMMEIAGRESKACSLGIFELNPEHDIDQRTARLAATAAYHFIAEKK